MDFPFAQEIDIWDVAATPEGGILVLGVLHYGDRRIDHVILRYQPSGFLSKTWHVSPYHHHKLAVDRDGNVFAFGHRIDSPDGLEGPDYPLLIKYSPDGVVLKEFLDRSLFPLDMDVVSSGERFGEPLLLVTNDSLTLFVAATKEVFRFDLQGQLLDQFSLSPLFEEIAAAAGRNRVEVLSLGVSKRGDLIAQTRFWPQDRQSDKLSFQMIRIVLHSSSWEPLSQITPLPYPGIFLGISRDAKFIFLNRRPGGEPALGRYEGISW
jgi:hypothetical protein